VEPGAQETESETEAEVESVPEDDATPAEAPPDDPPDDPPDGGEPPKAKLPGRDPIWARLMVFFGAILVVVAGTAVVGSRVLAHRYESSVNQENLLAPAARVTGPPAERHSTILGPLNYLLIGSDLRANNPADGQRSDTIIIVHVPVTLDRAYLVSIPRDLRVHVPAFPATGFGGGTEKINGAFQHGGGGNGGVQLLSQTLTELLGIRFDGAAIIDFGGFQKAVQLLGGVDMCIDVRTVSHHIGHDKDGNYLAPYDGPDGEHRNLESTPVVYEPGCQHLAAWQALDYVRQRKGLPNGDYDRQRHQQQFLRAVFNAAQEKHLTTNPIALDGFIRAVGQSLTVDTNGVALDELMFGLRNLDPTRLTGVELPSVPEDRGGISYVIAKPEAQGLFDAVNNDTLDTWTTDNPTWVNNI
jgi:LCP family protein required for cell wall assembly